MIENQGNVILLTMGLKEREPSKENLVRVVRGLVVSLAPLDELWQLIDRTDDDISVLRFYLGLKGGGKTQRLTLLGGKIRPHEPFDEAVHREVYEEGSFTPLGIPWQTRIGNWRYKIPGRDLPPRQVTLTYYPVQPANPDELLQGDEKIERVVSLTYQQLEELFENGKIKIQIGDQERVVPLEEHLRKHPPDIFLSPEDERNQQEAVEKGLRWMSHLEAALDRKVKRLLQEAESKEEFEKKYLHLLSHYMTRGLKAGIKFKKPGEKEDENQRKTPDILRSLNQGFLGRDILYYLPHLIKLTSDDIFHLPNEEVELPQGVEVFLSFLNEVINGFLEAQNYSSLEELKNKLLDENLTLGEKNEIITSLNEYFRNSLKKLEEHNLTDDLINDAIRNSQTFLHNLSLNLRTIDPNLKQIYQDFALLDEVKNANLGQLLLFFLGLDTKENEAPVNKQLRFESGRQLLFILKMLDWLPYYKANIEEIIEGNKLQLAVTNFFGSPIGIGVVRVGSEKLITHIRRWGRFQVIVDEKPLPKSWDSFLRKSFFEEWEKIVDFLNVNVVFVGSEDERGKKMDEIEIVEKARQLITDFETYLRNEYPNSQITVNEIYEYGTPEYKKMLERGQADLQEVKGKRLGSQGNRLVRYKVIIEMNGEKLEFIVYPFISAKSPFMGWKEKIEDDPDYFIRRVLAGAQGIPSLYSLIYPPAIYPDHYSQKIQSGYHKD